jgi:diguanylate cyclase (GGDEF)-like protein/PAS domain S-box-containing protein
VATPNRLSEFLRVTADASMIVAAGARGPDAVRAILVQTGTALGARRASFTVLGVIPSSIVWGSVVETEAIDVLVHNGGDDRAILHLWAEPLTDDERAAAEALGGILLAVSGPAALEGSDVDRWLRRHLDSVPVVTYTEYAQVDHTSGYAEVYVSPQIEPMLGYTPTEWVEDDDMDRWLDAIHPDDRERYESEIERSASTGDDYEVEYRMRHKNTGEWVWVRDMCRLVQVEGDAQPYWHGAMIDVTEQKRLEEQIAFLAYHDSLTELPNRKRLEEELEQALARAGRTSASVAVAFLDLDRFKAVNDTYGHDCGDRLLQVVADRLRDATRATDLVARVGGDEFLVLVADIEPRSTAGPHLVTPSRARDVMAELAERIGEALAAPVEVDGHVVTTGAAIGISIFPDHAHDGRALLQQADLAMYSVKRGVRGPGYAIAGGLADDEAAG